MNVTYPLKGRPVHPNPERDPNSVIYLLGLALVAGIALVLWTLV